MSNQQLPQYGHPGHNNANSGRNLPFNQNQAGPSTGQYPANVIVELPSSSVHLLSPNQIKLPTNQGPPNQQSFQIGNQSNTIPI